MYSLSSLLSNYSNNIFAVQLNGNVLRNRNENATVLEKDRERKTIFNAAFMVSFVCSKMISLGVYNYKSHDEIYYCWQREQKSVKSIIDSILRTWKEIQERKRQFNFSGKERALSKRFLNFYPLYSICQERRTFWILFVHSFKRYLLLL